MGDHAVGLRRQVGQQLVFDRRQVQRFALRLDDPAHQVDLDLAERDDRVTVGRLLPVAAQLRTHAGQKFAGTESNTSCPSDSSAAA